MKGQESWSPELTIFASFSEKSSTALCTYSERNDKPVATVGDPALSSAFASALHERRDFLKRSHVPIGTWILTCLVGYEIP